MQNHNLRIVMIIKSQDLSIIDNSIISLALKSHSLPEPDLKIFIKYLLLQTLNKARMVSHVRSLQKTFLIKNIYSFEEEL